MVEDYIGVKFKPICESHEIPKDSRISELIKWGKTLAEKGLAPTYKTPQGIGSGGNLSLRVSEGMIITASYSHLGTLKDKDFTRVLSCDVEKREVHFVGVRNPSSESIMHWLIYQDRPEVNAIFHFHDDTVVRNAHELGLPVTKRYYPYGMLELAREAVSALNNHWFLVLRDHGCLSLGKSIDEAGELALEVHEKALDLI